MTCYMFRRNVTCGVTRFEGSFLKTLHGRILGGTLSVTFRNVRRILRGRYGLFRRSLFSG